MHQTSFEGHRLLVFEAQFILVLHVFFPFMELL